MHFEDDDKMYMFRSILFLKPSDVKNGDEKSPNAIFAFFNDLLNNHDNRFVYIGF